MNLYRVIDTDGYVLRIFRSRNEAMRMKDIDKNVKIEIVKCSREKVKGTYEWAYQTVGECRL